MSEAGNETEVEYRVTAEGVEKAFGDNKVLKGVSFSVERGTATTIIGPSGSGKTTLLRALNALDVPDAGVVRVGDVEVDFSKPVAEGPAAALPRAERICVPVAQSVSRTRRCWRTSPRDRSSSRSDRRTRRRPTLWSFSLRSGWPRSGTSSRSNCPAGNSSGSASRGRWR